MWRKFLRVGFCDQAPAGLLLHGFEPFVDGFFGAFGFDFCDVGFERHVCEALAVNAADFGLVGVVIRWAEKCAGDAAFGDGLEVAFGWVDLDGGFLDELGAPWGVEDVLDGFFLG